MYFFRYRKALIKENEQLKKVVKLLKKRNEELLSRIRALKREIVLNKLAETKKEG